VSTAPQKNRIISDSSDDEQEQPRKRRRIVPIIDDDDSDEGQNQKIIEDGPNILELIGEPTAKNNTININPKLADLWRSILEKGLNSEVKKKIQEKIPTIENCVLEAPKLNEEIKITLSSSAKTRDEKLCDKQNQIGQIISNLNVILKRLIDKNDKENIEPLGDSIRFLADLHYMESQTRRAVILPGLNKNLKETLENTGIKDSLFGTDLHKVLKRSKDLEKSIKDLQSKPTSSTKTLNYWSPSLTSSQPQGGQRRKYNNQYNYLNRIRHQQRNYYRYGGAAAQPARNASAQFQWQPRRPARGRGPMQQATAKKV
jgi:hypothetical protein